MTKNIVTWFIWKFSSLCESFHETPKQKQRRGFSLKDSTYATHIWHLFLSLLCQNLSKDSEDTGTLCLSSTVHSLLKQEGREKQIMNVNAQKHKAIQTQLPRTAWHSWQFERSTLNAFYSCKQKTDLSRCTRAQLPKQPTSCSLSKN